MSIIMTQGGAPRVRLPDGAVSRETRVTGGARRVATVTGLGLAIAPRVVRSRPDKAH